MVLKLRMVLLWYGVFIECVPGGIVDSLIGAGARIVCWQAYSD